MPPPIAFNSTDGFTVVPNAAAILLVLPLLLLLLLMGVMFMFTAGVAGVAVASCAEWNDPRFKPSPLPPLALPNSDALEPVLMIVT